MALFLTRLTIPRLTIAVVILTTATASEAETTGDLEGDYLYKVSTVRAAVGSLADLLEWIGAVEDAGYYDDAGETPPLLMRHSQGDQWDLMIISPMQSFNAHYTDAASNKRRQAGTKHAQLLAQADDLLAYDADHFAYGPPLPVIENAYRANRFFHIEMFEAAAGNAASLIEQRRMENRYLIATGQTPNVIFRRAAGSDVDVFTIGFHKSLEAFAAPSEASDEEKEAAAKSAGFEDRADISFYLRSLITGHHDTLAVRVD